MVSLTLTEKQIQGDILYGSHIFHIYKILLISEILHETRMVYV